MMNGKLQLPSVTLLTATSVDFDNAQLALLLSSMHVEFGAIKMLSSDYPLERHSHIRYERIPEMDFLGYSRFMLEELHNFVDTPHCLIVQADGFVLSPQNWNPAFLEFDYIGAPWPETLLIQPGNGTLALGNNRVGNGGFSLRSRKLLEATAQVNFDDLDFPIKSEDLVICHYLGAEMQATGIRFAPLDLAAQFSIESGDNLHGQTLKSVFGFHGKHWRDALFRHARQLMHR